MDKSSISIHLNKCLTRTKSNLSLEIKPKTTKILTYVSIGLEKWQHCRRWQCTFMDSTPLFSSNCRPLDRQVISWTVGGGARTLCYLFLCQKVKTTTKWKIILFLSSSRPKVNFNNKTIHSMLHFLCEKVKENLEIGKNLNFCFV